MSTREPDPITLSIVRVAIAALDRNNLDAHKALPEFLREIEASELGKVFVREHPDQDLEPLPQLLRRTAAGYLRDTAAALRKHREEEGQ
jgi:hypothetical protein